MWILEVMNCYCRCSLLIELVDSFVMVVVSIEILWAIEFGQFFSVLNDAFHTKQLFEIIFVPKVNFHFWSPIKRKNACAFCVFQVFCRFHKYMQFAILFNFFLIF